MNIIVWIIQSVLAGMFAFSGLLILFLPKMKLAPKMPFVNDYSPAMVKFVAVAHILGALGLVLPMAMNILPILTPVAAGCLTLVMVLAVNYNLGRKDTKSVVVDTVIGILFLFIAYYRFNNL